MCVDIISFVEQKRNFLGKEFEKIGIYSFLGPKRYLIFDATNGWDYIDLSLFQRIFRCLFGCYQNTHLRHIHTQICLEYNTYNTVDNKIREKKDFPLRLLDKIKVIFFQTYQSGGTDLFIFPKTTRELNINCKEVGVNFQGGKKELLYQKILGKNPLDEKIKMKKYKFEYPEDLLSQPLFSPDSKLEIGISRDSYFAYPENDDKCIHFTVNYSKNNLYDDCQKDFLDYSGLQAIEHPALNHLRSALEYQGTLQSLKANEGMLIYGAKRYASFNPFIKTGSFFGEIFNKIANRNQLFDLLTVLPSPKISNIFAISAPKITSKVSEREYSRKDLEFLFFSAATAFSAIKFEHPTTKTVVHIGYLDLGSLGNGYKAVALMQLAAAFFSKIDRIEYYPLQYEEYFSEAEGLLKAINNEYRKITLDEFFEYLEEHAKDFGLQYTSPKN